MNLKQLYHSLKCGIGLHEFEYVSGTRKQTGFAVQHLFFAVHEYQIDKVCLHCRRQYTRFGMVPHSIDYKFHPDEHKKDPPDAWGWPLNAEGKRLPSRADAGKDIPKPVFVGFAEPGIKTFKPIIGKCE